MSELEAALGFLVGSDRPMDPARGAAAMEALGGETTFLSLGKTFKAGQETRCSSTTSTLRARPTD